jgi:hypothetical protein
MKRLFTVFMLICLVFAFVPAADAQVKFRGFTALTGGGTGALDKIPIAELTNGDIGFVATDTYFYVYKFNSAATNAESSPNYIRPNDYATAGVWVLTGLYGVTLKGGPSATPTIEFYDSDATDGDINAKIYVNCTTTTSGAENCVMYFQNQVGGTLATRLTIDASGNVLAVGVLDGLSKVTLTTGDTANIGTTYMAEYTLNNNGTAANATTYTLPAALSTGGQQMCIRNYTGKTGVLAFQAPASVYLDLDGTNSSAAKKVKSGGAAGDAACAVSVDATHWIIYPSKGTWAIDNS